MTAKKSFMNCISRPFLNLYFGYTFSCIGDRLWSFALVLLLERLGGMRLISANQLIEGVSAMFLATYVGNWLDRHNRRLGALTVLAVNNISIACSATFLIICLTIKNQYGKDSKTSLSVQHNLLYALSLVLSIIFCAISKCASEGQKLALTKDWIVVMSNHDKSGTLSGRNASMTTIDQISSVIAPIITGYMLVYGGYRFACALFIVWNFVSWIGERYFLLKVYNQVHELAIREKSSVSSDSELEQELDVLLGHSHSRHNGNNCNKISIKNKKKYLNNESRSNSFNSNKMNDSATILKKDSNQKLDFYSAGDVEIANNGDNQKLSARVYAIWHRMLSALHAYRRQRVFAAAFSLALLYMTVLGFDGLAISHGKAQNLPDDFLGGFRSAGSILGIAGAFLYTLVERNIGVHKTGLLGLSLQQLFLWLCVISIWLPGSPFDPIDYGNSWTFKNWVHNSISAFSGESSSSPMLSNSTLGNFIYNTTTIGETMKKRETLSNFLSATNFAESAVLQPQASAIKIDWQNWTIDGRSIIAVFVFFCGITFARLGLWMADLSITQILQESIAEEERNTVFGTQTAFCLFFSVLKDIIAVLFPDHRTFGLLIIMSIVFVILGFLFYVYYLTTLRKYQENNPSKNKEFDDINEQSFLPIQ